MAGGWRLHSSLPPADKKCPLAWRLIVLHTKVVPQTEAKLFSVMAMGKALFSGIKNNNKEFLSPEIYIVIFPSSQLPFASDLI